MLRSTRRSTTSALIELRFGLRGQLGLNDSFGRGLWARRYRQMPRAQFLDVRQLVEIPQTEVIEEEFGRLVKQRTPGNFGAPGNFHEAAFHQRLQNAVDGNTAHRFNVRARDRLAISNDRERFERR